MYIFGSPMRPQIIWPVNTRLLHIIEMNGINCEDVQKESLAAVARSLLLKTTLIDTPILENDHFSRHCQPWIS